MITAVTGATGFVGSHLVRRLLRDRHQVRALVRKPTDRWANQPGVTLVEGSIDNVAAMTDAFRGADCVYHLVGLIAETRTQTFETTVVGGTRNVVQAAVAAGAGKLVYLSAMGTEAEALSRYHRTKYEAEQTVIGSGLPYVILRPSVIYGPGDGFVSLLAKLIRRSPVTPVFGSGRYQLQPVYIDDMTEIMTRALTSKSVLGQIVDCGGPEKLEYVSILDHIGAVLGKRRFRLHLPMAAARLMAVVLETFLRPAPLTRDQLLMMETGNTGDIARMKELFGVDPIGFAEGLKRYLR